MRYVRTDMGDVQSLHNSISEVSVKLPFLVSIEIVSKLLGGRMLAFKTGAGVALIASGVGSVIACGCVGGAGAAPNGAIPQLSYAELSTPSQGEFWLAADSQLHNVTAGESFWRSERVDNYAPGAIRPPSVDLWSGLVLRSIVESMNTDDASSGMPRPLFYLGDASDISCTVEYRDFLRIMAIARGDESHAPWFAVPGNHDGFYEGNITRRPDIPARRRGSGQQQDPFDAPATNAVWSDACFTTRNQRLLDMSRIVHFEQAYLIGGRDKKQPDGAMRTHGHQGTLSKATSTLLYISNLYTRKFVGVDPLDRASWHPTRVLDAEGRYEDVLRYTADSTYVSNGKSLGFRVRASITPTPGPDDDREWRSYVVQDVELIDGTHVILADTSDLSFTPLSKYMNGISRAWRQLFDCSTNTHVVLLGECGAFSEYQRADIEQLMSSWSTQTSYFVMGHHPIYSFGPASVPELSRLFGRRGFISYVSAHTHFAPSVAQVPGRNRWELNIGSTTDWPIHYVRVGYSATDSPTLRVDVLRPKAKTACPYKDNENTARGINAYLDRAIANYRDVFTWIRQNVPPDRIAVLDTLPGAVDFACPAQGCLAHFEDRIRAMRTMSVADKRPALAVLVAFDRAVLQTEVAIRDMETSCAMFESESDIAAGSHSVIRNGISLPLTLGRPLQPPSRQ